MKLIDLSHPINEKMSTYPTDPKVSIVKEKNIDSDGTLLHRISMGTHTGTHIDVPAHIIPNGKKLHNYPLKTFTGTAIKVDNNCYRKINELEENLDGIIYDTGWYKSYGNADIFFGDKRPIIPEKLVQIAINLELKFFGCYFPSVDESGSIEKPIHNSLLKSDIIIYETLTNLNELPMLNPFSFFGFPLAFTDLDGSPVRAGAYI